MKHAYSLCSCKSDISSIMLMSDKLPHALQMGELLQHLLENPAGAAAPM